MSKKWYFSKTVWVQILAVIIGGIQAIQGQSWLPIETQLVILAMLNIIVRFLTNQPITK